MSRIVLAAIVLCSIFPSATPSDGGNPGEWKVTEAEPDPRLARPLDHWPNAADLTRLQAVEGKPKATVLCILGHPSWVERRPDGEEVWDYPWCATCRLWIRKGICTGTFYTGGY